MTDMVRDPRELMAQPIEQGTKDVEAAQAASVQQRAREGRGHAGLSLFLWQAAGAGELMPGWWSRARDAELRRFWKRVDHLSGAVYTMESIISTIPFHIEPVDPTIALHRRQAEQMEEMILNENDFDEGWGPWVSKWVEDHITQDNGAFSEVIGEGDPDGPIKGPVLGVAHMDSRRCTRTGDPEFPVLYTDTDGKLYKMHRSRVMIASSMPSPAVEMNGVGFCAVSRCVNVSQTLLDMLVYRQEKLGSRPAQGILVTKGGLDPDDVGEAFEIAEQTMDNKLLRRYGKFVVVGDRGLPEAGMEKVDLFGLPEGFDEKEATTLAMAAMALAFGTDPRELFPGMTIGATRAEALIAHLKQRGKGPGQILETLERLHNSKVLPPHLKMKFDFQDDAQDEQRAEIKLTRASRRTEEIGSGVLDERGGRELALEEGDLTQAQFNDLELRDGRLPNGDDVLSLFYNPDYAEFLDLGVVDPLNAGAGEKPALKLVIVARRGELMARLGEFTEGPRRRPLVESLVALDRLEDAGKPAPKPPTPPVPGAPVPGGPVPGTQEPGQDGGAEHMPGPEDLDMDQTKAMVLVHPEDVLMAEALEMLRATKEEEDMTYRMPQVVVQAPDVRPFADALRENGELQRAALTVVGEALDRIADGQREMAEALKQNAEAQETQAAATEERTKELMEREMPTPTVVFDAAPMVSAIQAAIENIGAGMGEVAKAITDQKPPVVNLPETPVSLEVKIEPTRVTKKIVRDALGRADTIIEDSEPAA
jgi:hypothetical protein